MSWATKPPSGRRVDARSCSWRASLRPTWRRPSRLFRRRSSRPGSRVPGSKVQNRKRQRKMMSMQGDMRVRWAVAAMSALGLALLTMSSSEVFDFSAHASGASCPANAKPAKLNFSLKDFTGKTVRLSDYKGKVLLIDFWATWCEPCKLEIPWFVEFQKKYGPSGFQAIGVPLDGPPAQTAPCVAREQLQ